MKFLKWIRRLLCKHNFELYIYYNKWSYIYRCEKCGLLEYFDISNDMCTTDQDFISDVRKTISLALNLPNDSEILESTNKLKKKFKDEKSLKQFVEDVKKDKVKSLIK